MREHLFSIQYIPEGGLCANEECHRVLPTLYEALEYIKVGGDLVRGSNMVGDVVGGVLTFIVSFDFFVTVKQGSEIMGELDHNQIVG